MLETRTPSCFSSEYVLVDNGRPCGRFRGRAFSGTIDVSLLQRYRLAFGHHGFLSSRYTLTDTRTGETLGSARHAGLFNSAWELTLSVGPCRLVSAGWFNPGFFVEQNGRQLAEVNVSGGCDGRWHVRPIAVLPLTDQVLIGLVFHTILRRRRRNRSSSV